MHLWRWVRARQPSASFPAGWLPFDYRFAALGGILPDLIDKPIGWFLMPSLPDDHLWGHSLWLPAVLIGLGLLFGRRFGDARLLLLGLGTLTHLIVDPVNAHPRTLFWPLFGTPFPDVRGYLWLFPIALEVVLLSALFFTLRRFDPLRARMAAFRQSGTV
jgi:hypothetical protein